ncbi:MAG: hypothetical protein AAGF89_04705 [Bacteroidota bacterium]
MRYFPNLLLSFLLVLSSSWVVGQVSELPLMPSSGITSYGNLPVAELNRAHRQQLTGQFEVALMTYNSALAFQPNWVPALTARAALYYRLGRELEAKRDELLAARQNPEATALFLAKGHNALLPFLALYPQDWYAEHYGFTGEVNLPGEVNTSQSYFTYQYVHITEAPDTALAVKMLQQKLDHDILASQRSLEELPRDYNPTVRKMLEANLAMLNHDYPAAINLYTDAELNSTVKWPELKYNRGLGYILMHNYMNGCQDLSASARAGFAPAATMFSGLCNF